MSWEEDFAYALEMAHAPNPVDFGPKEAVEAIGLILVGIDASAEGATVAEVLSKLSPAGARQLAPIAAAAGALLASYYAGAMIGAVLYATAKNYGEEILAPVEIDVDKLKLLAEHYHAPILALPASEDVSWYPAVTTVRETAPPIPPYPGLIKRGSRDIDVVEQIQQLLSSMGYPVEVDGDFQGDTETAVEDFQRDRGLAIDGEVGPDTWEALFR